MSTEQIFLAALIALPIIGLVVCGIVIWWELFQEETSRATLNDGFGTYDKRLQAIEQRISNKSS